MKSYQIQEISQHTIIGKRIYREGDEEDKKGGKRKQTHENHCTFQL